MKLSEPQTGHSWSFASFDIFIQNWNKLFNIFSDA